MATRFASVSLSSNKHAKRRAFLAVLGALSLTVGKINESRANSPFSDRIARRYRVERSAVERVIAIAEAHFPIDPALLLAIVGVESSWRPWAVGRLGEVGLCQVMPDLHGASATELSRPEVNLRVAAKVLRLSLKRSGGDVPTAIARYNGRGQAAQDYARRVLEERERIVDAQGKKR